MANVIGEFVAKITADSKKFTAGVNKSETRMGRFAAGVRKHGKAIALAFIAIGTAAAATAAKIIKDYAKAGDEIQKMALRTGFATETLSELRFAAELSGTSINSLEKAVKRMQQGIVDANRGLKESIDNFTDLGITLDDLTGKSPEEQFDILTTALAGVEDATLRAGIAAKVFGRAGTELLPMLAAGKQGLEDMKQEARDLGIVFDQEAANAAAQFNDNMTRLGKTMDGIKFKIAEELIPSVNALAVSLAQLFSGQGVVFGAAAQGATAIVEAYNRILKEQAKAQAGVENQLVSSVEAYIELAESLKIAGNLTRENFVGINTTINILKDWLAVEDERREAQELDIERQKATVIAEIEHRDALDSVIEGLRLQAVAEKELADAVIAAEEAKRFARTGRATGLIGQILEAGGAPTAGRLLEAQLLLEGFNPLAGGFDMVMDGQKVGQIVGDGMGDDFLSESHLSGG